MRNTLLALCLLASPAPAQSPIDSVQIITRDIPNFWHAYDQAAGKDSAERVRIFETVYLQPGSPGLRDWMRAAHETRHPPRAARCRRLAHNAALLVAPGQFVKSHRAVLQASPRRAA